jgi:hypothetical protein
MRINAAPARAAGYDLGGGLGVAVYESIHQRAEPVRHFGFHSLAIRRASAI